MQVRPEGLPSPRLRRGGRHFAGRLASRPPETWLLAPEGEDHSAWQFTVGPDETAEDLYRLWEDAVGRSRERLRRALADGGLDQSGEGAVR